ncbi:pentatricopeptide repeat-containing protein At3g12770-like [Ananas comosus]|uniref:Pentatricopeptide repeat-containing protein At3g12770-like n=1 Tax=Ananas comosus TaxID=4615 RepID=A0A6P5FVJ5_ANACO|nr:pentatricopeptide repeat-containing protein At3g12770-like [Ananas comosus]
MPQPLPPHFSRQTPSSSSHSLPFYYTSLLNSISSLHSLKLLHARILTDGLSRRLSLTTKLLSLAALLSPTMRYARQLFDDSPHRDSFMYNTLIRGYTDVGPCDQVPLLYKTMHGIGLSPDCFTFPFVIRACAVLSAVREGKEAHCNAIKHGFDRNHFVQSGLVTMYSQSGEVPDSELVFGEMGFKNVVSWTAMIAAYAQNCLFGKASGLFRSMVASGTRPNEVTLVSFLPVLKGLEGLYSGESIHGFAIKLGLDSYVSMMNALIAMHGKCGSIEIARSLFDGMSVRSLVSWNTMVALYEQSGDGTRAIKLFRTMLTEKVKFNSVTLVSVLSACASSGALDTGKWLHELARKNGLEADVRVGNVLIDMYSKCGKLDLAREAFDNLRSRSVVSYSAMVRAYASHGLPREALKLFSQMKAEGVRPNTFTFTSVLAACSHSGLVEEGLKHFYSMRKEYGITPTMEHCTCIVDMLGRAARLVEAYEFVKCMPIEPDTGVWGAFLGACRIHGELEMADSVAKELFRSGYNDVTFYVILSNMYAENGRWEDAEKLRKMMEEMELKKIAGCSLVGIERKPQNAPITR